MYNSGSFFFYILEGHGSNDIDHRLFKFSVVILDIQKDGNVSQVVYLFPCSYFILFRK